MFANTGWNAIVCLGDSASDCSESVAVSTDRNGVTDGIFKTGGLEEGHQCLRNRFLAGLIKLIAIPDAIQREVHWVVVLIHVVADLQNTFSLAGHKDGNHSGFCTFESFWMIVCNGSDVLRHFLCLVQG